VADLAQTVVGELLGEVTAFARFARRPHRRRPDGELVATGDVENDVAQITGFPRNALGDEAAADVALHAIDAGMRRGQIGGVFGRHGVAGRAAELR
jgi:hypothetical protein